MYGLGIRQLGDCFGIGGTEGTPRQCLEKGYCGFMLKQYDLSFPELPFGLPTDGLDREEGDGIMVPSKTEQMEF